MDVVIKAPYSAGVAFAGPLPYVALLFAGIMPSLLLIKAVYCLGKGMMLGAVLETAIQFTKKVHLVPDARILGLCYLFP